jgi:hypothetical protein
MPSKETFHILKDSSVDILSGDNLRFNSYDTLASEADLSALFEVLYSIKDKNGNPAVITPVSVMANPDFSKIKSSDFMEYFYEPFTETLKKTPGCNNSFSLWNEGIKERLFVPEFHGREHLNVNTWLRALRDGDPATQIAFNHGIWGFNNINPENISYQAAFDTRRGDDLDYHKVVLADGLKLFKKLLGYDATYFVPPNGIFNNTLLPDLKEFGVDYIFTQKIIKDTNRNKLNPYAFHYLGENKGGLRYITRNCVFEPSDKSRDWVDSCLSDIAIAFRWKKPAIISTHRVNFIGSLDPSNRSFGLQQLSTLLEAIMKSWSDAEFMTSAELGKEISKK